MIGHVVVQELGQSSVVLVELVVESEEAKKKLLPLEPIALGLLHTIEFEPGATLVQRVEQVIERAGVDTVANLLVVGYRAGIQAMEDREEVVRVRLLRVVAPQHGDGQGQVLGSREVTVQFRILVQEAFRCCSPRDQVRCPRV